MRRLKTWLPLFLCVPAGYLTFLQVIRVLPPESVAVLVAVIVALAVPTKF
jgi:hypothetical protein